jgi:hypothetical protein
MVKSQLWVDSVWEEADWAGVLECTASNRFGQDTATFHIIVEGDTHT